MDQNNSLNHGEGFPPPPGGFSTFVSSEGSLALKTEASGTRSLPPLGAVASGGMASTELNHDVIQISDNPPRDSGHRRTQSEFVLPDEIGLDFDLSIVGGVDGPSLSDEDEDEFVSLCLDLDTIHSSSATSGFEEGESSAMHGASSLSPGQQEVTQNMIARTRHQHTQSLDGSTMVNSEVQASSGGEPSAAQSRRSISEARLAQLAITDPKRAKRIWANRQSAARSKERKLRYIAELEEKLKNLQNEASMLSAQMALLQGDTSGLNAENNELTLRLQSVENQANLQEALNDALKEEIQHLKVMTDNIASGRSVFNHRPSFSGNPQYYSNNNANTMKTRLAAQQFQQLQINARRPQQHSYQRFQQQAQPLMQQREQLLQQSSGDMNVRGNVPLSYAHYGNASNMGNREWK